MGVPEFDDNNFESEVLNSSQPVLVDFWAPWCGPCRQIAPVIEQLAGENTGVKIGKLNVDVAPGAATSYGVSSIPTLMVFKDGQVVERFVGEGLTAESRPQIESNATAAGPVWGRPLFLLALRAVLARGVSAAGGIAV
jgi:thioredoxin 1